MAEFKFSTEVIFYDTVAPGQNRPGAKQEEDSMMRYIGVVAVAVAMILCPYSIADSFKWFPGVLFTKVGELSSEACFYALGVIVGVALSLTMILSTVIGGLNRKAARLRRKVMKDDTSLLEKLTKAVNFAAEKNHDNYEAFAAEASKLTMALQQNLGTLEYTKALEMLPGLEAMAVKWSAASLEYELQDLIANLRASLQNLIIVLKAIERRRQFWSRVAASGNTPAKSQPTAG